MDYLLFEDTVINILIVSLIFIVVRFFYYNLKYDVQGFKEAVFNDSIIGEFDDTIELYIKIKDSSIVNNFLFLLWCLSLCFCFVFYGHYFLAVVQSIVSFYVYTRFRNVIIDRDDFIESVRLICNECEISEPECLD